MSYLQNKKHSFIYLSIGTLIFIYILIRAITISVTIDELLTVTYLIDTWIYDAYITANNHFLNSFLVKFSCWLLGDSLFVARLPNVLAFLVYAFFSYRIASRNFSTYVGIACFVLLVCNPFMLDFFGLIRGYGLSFACMMAALYYGVENIKSYSNSTLIKSVIWASLSVYAIFSMVYFWGALVFALNLAVFLRKDKRQLRHALLYSFCIGFVSLAAMYEPIRKLKKFGGLYYGADDFYNQTLISLTKYSLYQHDASSFVYVLLALLLITFVVVIILSFQKNRTILSPRPLLLLILLLIICGLITAYYLLDVLYPMDRNSLFLYPLFILCLWFCFPDLKKRLRNTITSLLLIGSLINFACSVNLHKVLLWDFNAHGLTILETVNKSGKKKNKIMTLDTPPVFYFSLSYYLNKGDFPFVSLKTHGWDAPHVITALDSDYYIHLSKNDIHQHTEYDNYIIEMTKYDKDTFLVFPKENVIVYTNVKPKEIN